MNVTPRAWTSFLGELLGQETAEVELPEEWARASRELGGAPPARLLDDSGPDFKTVTAEELAPLFARIRETALAELHRCLESRSATGRRTP